MKPWKPIYHRTRALRLVYLELQRSLALEALRQQQRGSALPKYWRGRILKDQWEEWKSIDLEAIMEELR